MIFGLYNEDLVIYVLNKILSSSIRGSSSKNNRQAKSHNTMSEW